MKKIILGRSDAWSMSHLSHWPSKPAFYIDDCQISGRGRTLWNSTIYMKCGRNGWWQSWYVMSFFLMLSHSSLAHPSLALVCLMLDREGPPKSRVKKCICISSQSATLRTIKYKNVYVYGVTCHRIQVFSETCIYCPNQEIRGELNCKLSFKSENNQKHIETQYLGKAQALGPCQPWWPCVPEGWKNYARHATGMEKD